MNRSTCFRCRALFPFYGVCVLLVLLGANTAIATTYYVAPTGNDSTGDGSSGNPWATPQKCVTQVAAGDTCTVGDGTYTDTDSNGRTVLIASSNAASGTSSSPITLKSTNPNGAKIVVRTNLNQSQAGIYVDRSWWIIDGFEIYDDGGTLQGMSASIHAVYIAYGANNVVRNNTFHNLGRSVCSESLYGNTGIYLVGASNVIIERNDFHTIGRKRNGEGGCSTSIFQQDHGIYADATTNLTIRRNVIYDTNRGVPINVKAYTGTTTGLRVYHNTIAGKSPTGLPNGMVALTNTFNDSIIKNNIFYDIPSYVFWWYTTSVISPTSPGLVIQYNLSNTTGSTLLNPNQLPSSGITYSNNILNTNPGFTNVSCTQPGGGCGNTVFTLATGSAAINAGTPITGYAYNGSAPDIGAYEVSDGASTPARPTGLRVQ
jgi:hypothetical protein